MPSERIPVRALRYLRKDQHTIPCKGGEKRILVLGIEIIKVAEARYP